MKVTRRQLRHLIREALELDIVNQDTGEVFEFGEHGLSDHIPGEAWPDLQKRLGIQPVSTSEDGVYVSDEDYGKLDNEVRGKRSSRHRDREKKRMDIGNLQARLDQWIDDARSGYVGDNPGVDMQDVARDLAASAQYSFEPDEWAELMWDYEKDLEHGDYGSGEDLLLDIIADGLAG